MNIRQFIANKIDPTHKNRMGSDLARDYFAYGPDRSTSSLTQLVMGERDKYSGYMYAAVTRRANKVVYLAENYLRTSANEATTQAAKDAKETIVHPYLKHIDESPEFANDEFWRWNQSFIDIRGQAFIFALRGKVGNKVGEVKEFKLLRPEEITVVRDANDLNVIGYVETRGGMYREIEPHMVIAINTFNPLARNKPFSMADAATDAHFALKEMTEQMRTTTRRNRKYPGVVLFGNGDVALDEEQVANFKARMRGKSTQDEPMFASGSAGNISWNDMQVDMRKSALEMVNEIQLNALIAVTGTSKTKLGIEQSGVTRDTADIQDDLFTSDHAIPALQLIVSALNQDYKTHYAEDYERTGYRMFIDSPLGDDKETELKDVEIRTKSFDLYTSLRAKGYDQLTAAQYASGEKELTEIGEPTEKPAVKTAPAAAAKASEDEAEDQDDGDDPNKTSATSTTPASVSKNRALVLNQLSLKDVPGLLDDIDIVPENLGCIMINTETLPVLKHVEDGAKDLVTSTDRHDHTMGAVAETKAHVTLLFGLLENGNVWKDKVDQVLNGWQLNEVTIDQVGAFDLGDGFAIVAHIEKTPELIEGHERLTLLPHIQTFSEYKPHLTLAYVKHDQAIADRWIKALGDQYNGTTVKTAGINYGDEPEDDADDQGSRPAGSVENANQHADHVHEVPAVIRNQLGDEQQTVIVAQEAALMNAVINVDGQLVSTVVGRLSSGSYELGEPLATEEQQAQAVAALTAALAPFYVAVLPMQALAVMARRIVEFGRSGDFTVDELIEEYIEATARKAAESHVRTILDELTAALNEAVQRLVREELEANPPQPGEDVDDVLALARRKALEGVGQQRIIAAIRDKYSSISRTRAEVIARTESRRAYNRAQFEADRQFLAQNDMTARAYKKWVTRSDNPCVFCKAMAAKPPIPFLQPFVKVGDVLNEPYEKANGTMGVQTFRVGFEDSMAGEIHPNGWCTYQLIVE